MHLLWPVWIAVATSFFSIILVVFLSWLIHRTNAPGRRFLDVFIFCSFFLLPPLPTILGWIIIFSPNAGIGNQLFGIQLLNIFSVQGIIFTTVAYTFPFYYIFISPAFKAMDTTLEEAARTSGASTFSTLFRITFPLLTPVILATAILSFVRGMEGFEVPLFLGVPARIYVLPTKIFDYIQGQPSQYPPAMAAGIILLLITFMLVLLQWRIMGQREFITVTGKGYRPRPMDIGLLRYPLFILGLVIVSALTIPPMIVLIQNTFMRVAGVYMPDMYTLANYSRAFSEPEIWDALKNTAILGVSAATLGMILCTLISYVAVKTNFREKRAVDIIAWIPWAVPSIVLALGFLWAYVLFRLPGGVTLYGTIWVLILAMITKGFPIGTRNISSGMIQISKELEESARVSGASWMQSLYRIWLPLLKNSFINGWVILFSLSVRDLATVILLFSPSSAVLSTIFFEFWSAGKLETASVIGILQAGLIAVGFLAARLLGARRTTDIAT